MICVKITSPKFKGEKMNYDSRRKIEMLLDIKVDMVWILDYYSFV